MSKNTIYLIVGAILVVLGAGSILSSNHSDISSEPSLGAAQSTNQVYEITSTDQSIQAVIDMAVDGDTLSIATNDTFYQSFDVNKSLNMVAANGFTPRLQRPVSGRESDDPIITIPSVPGKSVKLKIDGLTIGNSDITYRYYEPNIRIFGAYENYINTFIVENSEISGNYNLYSPYDLTTDTNDENNVLLRLEVTNSTLSGKLDLSVNNSDVEVEITDSTIGGMNHETTGTSSETYGASIIISNTTFTDEVRMSSRYSYINTMVIEDSTLKGLTLRTEIRGRNDVSISRSYMVDSVFVTGDYQSPSVVKIDNSLLIRSASSTGTTTGLFGDDYGFIEANNVTVVDYDYAIETQNANSSFTNMLLLDSRNSDIHFSTDPESVSSSLLSDGVEGDGFVGVRGNISGQPAVDDQFNLLPGSIGIDAGSNDIEQTVDYNGAPRVQDGNSDGRAQVDMGAVEYQVESNGLTVDNDGNINTKSPVALNSWGSGFNASYKYKVTQSDTKGGTLQRWRIEADTGNEFYVSSAWINDGYNASVQLFNEGDTFVMSNENEQQLEPLVAGDLISFTIQGNGADYKASDITLNFVALTARASAESTCTDPERISLPFSFDGEGEFCWQITGSVEYVNSWNADSITINESEFANRWSNALPAAIDGKYTVYYNGLFPWSHFEVGGSD